VVGHDLRDDSCSGGKAGLFLTSQAAMMEQSINFPFSTTQRDGRKSTSANTESRELVALFSVQGLFTGSYESKSGRPWF
jgi:hypothetical protein